MTTFRLTRKVSSAEMERAKFSSYMLELLDAGVYSIDPSGAVWTHKRRVFRNKWVSLDRPTRAEQATAGGDTYCLRRRDAFGKMRQIAAHDLVWLASIGPIPKGFHVQHKNGDGRDNRLCNLKLAEAKKVDASRLGHLLDDAVKEQAADTSPFYAAFDRARIDYILELVRAGVIRVDPEAGTVWRLASYRWGLWKEQRKPSRMDLQVHTYRRVAVRTEAAMITVAAHRLIWEYVNGPIPHGRVIDHKDGNGSNNNISNLEPVTQQVNVRRGRRCRKDGAPVLHNRKRQMTLKRKIEHLLNAINLFAVLVLLGAMVSAAYGCAAVKPSCAVINLADMACKTVAVEFIDPETGKKSTVQLTKGQLTGAVVAATRPASSAPSPASSAK